MKYTISGINGTLGFLFVDPDQWILNEDGLTSYDPSLGLEESTLASDIKVYPNPTDKDVFIEFGKEVFNVEIELFDITGRLVSQSDKISGTEYQFSLNEKKGTYLMKIKFADGSVKEFKVVKE